MGRAISWRKNEFTGTCTRPNDLCGRKCETQRYIGPYKIHLYKIQRWARRRRRPYRTNGGRPIKKIKNVNWIRTCTRSLSSSYGGRTLAPGRRAAMTVVTVVPVTVVTDVDFSSNRSDYFLYEHDSVAHIVGIMYRSVYLGGRYIGIGI